MKPGRFNLSLVQGDSFQLAPSWKINGSYVNVTGFSADMQVRQAVTSTSIIVELSSANGRITVGGIDGTFTLDLTAAETTEIPAGNYLYDLDVTSPDGDVYTLLSGGFTVNSQVTR